MNKSDKPPNIFSEDFPKRAYSSSWPSSRFDNNFFNSSTTIDRNNSKVNPSTSRRPVNMRGSTPEKNNPGNPPFSIEGTTTSGSSGVAIPSVEPKNSGIQLSFPMTSQTVPLQSSNTTSLQPNNATSRKPGKSHSFSDLPGWNPSGNSNVGIVGSGSGNSNSNIGRTLQRTKGTSFSHNTPSRLIPNGPGHNTFFSVVSIPSSGSSSTSTSLPPPSSLVTSSTSSSLLLNGAHFLEGNITSGVPSEVNKSSGSTGLPIDRISIGDTHNPLIVNTVNTNSPVSLHVTNLHGSSLMIGENPTNKQLEFSLEPIVKQDLVTERGETKASDIHPTDEPPSLLPAIMPIQLYGSTDIIWLSEKEKGGCISALKTYVSISLALLQKRTHILNGTQRTNITYKPKIGTLFCKMDNSTGMGENFVVIRTNQNNYSVNVTKMWVRPALAIQGPNVYFSPGDEILYELSRYGSWFRSTDLETHSFHWNSYLTQNNRSFVSPRERSHSYPPNLSIISPINVRELPPIQLISGSDDSKPSFMQNSRKTQVWPPVTSDSHQVLSIPTQLPTDQQSSPLPSHISRNNFS